MWLSLGNRFLRDTKSKYNTYEFKTNNEAILIQQNKSADYHSGSLLKTGKHICRLRQKEEFHCQLFSSIFIEIWFRPLKKSCNQDFQKPEQRTLCLPAHQNCTSNSSQTLNGRLNSWSMWRKKLALDQTWQAIFNAVNPELQPCYWMSRLIPSPSVMKWFHMTPPIGAFGSLPTRGAPCYTGFKIDIKWK